MIIVCMKIRFCRHPGEIASGCLTCHKFFSDTEDVFNKTVCNEEDFRRVVGEGLAFWKEAISKKNIHFIHSWANVSKYDMLQITAGSKKPAKIRGEKGEHLWNGKII